MVNSREVSYVFLYLRMTVRLCLYNFIIFSDIKQANILVNKAEYCFFKNVCIWYFGRIKIKSEQKDWAREQTKYPKGPLPWSI